MIFETHAHYDDERFEEDRDALITSMPGRGVGTVINVPIETSDMSMDRNHCVINVKRNKQGKLVYTLRDAPSLTGTFLNNEILGDKDRVRIEDGAIVTIGATTFILRAAE